MNKGWLLAFLRPHRGAILGIVGLSLTATALALAQPYITKLLIDNGLLARRPGVILELALLMVALAATSTVLSWFNRKAYTLVSARILFAMRERTYAHLLTLSPDFHARRGTGELIARLDGDIAEVQRFGLDSLLGAISAVFGLAGTLGILFWLSGPLALIALVLLPAQVLYLRQARPRVEQATRALRERATDLTRFLVDTLTAAKFIQSVNGAEHERARLEGLNGDFLRALIRQQWVGFNTSSVPALAGTVGTAAVFIAGGYIVAEGRLSVGTLIAFAAYLARAAGPAQSLLGIYVASQRARVSIDRIGELWAEQPAVRPPEHPRPLPAGARGEIRMEGVSFRYPGAGAAPSAEVLAGVDLHIPAGAKVGIVGASGAGKSTLVDLLTRHFDPDRGRITLDGVNLRDLDLALLRRRVAVVLQDVTLLPLSMADNIRYPDMGVPVAAVREAAGRAQASGFIEALPEGYDTVAGFRGLTLSGGERQRIAIARALLLDPLVLVLDEATAALDLAAERRVLEEIDRLFAGRTRIVITHRLASLRDADLLFELEGGRLKSLTPAELKARA